MTEPQVASSDATNIQCEIKRGGNDYVINGRRWFTSGAMNEDCAILIVMGKTAPDHPDRHRQQSMIVVPKATPGVRIVRDMRRRALAGHFPGACLCLRPLHPHWRRAGPGASCGSGQGADQAGRSDGRVTLLPVVTRSCGNLSGEPA
nr:acyl-CoA dehydrogenase family protein [Bradyrhizobium sp. 199]